MALLAAFLALVLARLLGLAAAAAWEDTRAQIAKLGSRQIDLPLGLSLVNFGFRCLSWHFFAQAFCLPMGLEQNLRHVLGGFATSVTPGRIGEVIRVR